jgi:Gpi18-like mannosyltransferase
MLSAPVFWPWFLSRVAIAIAMVALAPHLPDPQGRGHVPTMDWSVFAQWDGEWYEKIATKGYDYVPDGQTHSIPFFPLYPLLSHMVMAVTGWRFAVAGVVVNSLAFFGALAVIYRMMVQQYGESPARWTVQLLAWCPLSIFCMVTYTEGLFLLVTALALESFGRGAFGRAAIFGILTTATRLTGLPLVLGFISTAWQKRWPKGAYWAAGLSSLGLIAYMIYCWRNFGDPIAFSHAQKAFGHRSAAGFNCASWGKVVLHTVVGPLNKVTGAVKNIGHPLQFMAIELFTVLLWRFRRRVKAEVLPWLGFVLGIWLWLLAGDGAIKLAAVVGGVSLLWGERHRLGLVLTHYGFWALLLVLISGSAVSAERYVYAIVSLGIAGGLWLSRHPLWGKPILLGFGIVMVSMAVRFAQGLWVA